MLMCWMQEKEKNNKLWENKSREKMDRNHASHWTAEYLHIRVQINYGGFHLTFFIECRQSNHNIHIHIGAHIVTVSIRNALQKKKKKKKKKKPSRNGNIMTYSVEKSTLRGTNGISGHNFACRLIFIVICTVKRLAGFCHSIRNTNICKVCVFV